MTTEQMSVPAQEQIADPAEQVAPVANAEVDAVASAPDRAVAEPTFDLSTPEGVRAAAAQYPAMKAVFSEYENTGRQRTLAEIQREQGSVEHAQQTVEWAAEQINQGADPRQIAKAIIPHVKANENWARAEMLRGLIAQARTLDEDAVAPLAELADAMQGNASEIEPVAQAALNAIANNTRRTARTEVFDIEDIAQIPADSKLGKAFRDWAKKEAEIELNAREIERTPIAPGSPTAPGGTAAEQISKTVLDNMASANPGSVTRMAVEGSDEQRDAMWEAAMRP